MVYLSATIIHVGNKMINNVFEPKSRRVVGMVTYILYVNKKQ